MSDELLAEAYNRGLAAEKSGDRDAAAEAYRQVLDLDPNDHGGASIRLAAMGLGPVPAAAPEAYVATLFDQNAADFDNMLVEQLGYAVPMLVRERFAELGLGPFQRMLDLGCGTGLTGASMMDLAEEIVGVDLSEEMLDEAYDRACYDALYVAEAVAFLAEADEAPWDLIAATDVLPYLGVLEPFLKASVAALAPGGVLTVSTETLPDAEMAGRNFFVGPKHRYAHAKAYLESSLTTHGLAALEILDIVVRYDEGEPVPGYLVTARRS